MVFIRRRYAKGQSQYRQLQSRTPHQRRLAGILLGKQPPVQIAAAVHLLMSESFCYYIAIGG